MVVGYVFWLLMVVLLGRARSAALVSSSRHAQRHCRLPYFQHSPVLLKAGMRRREEK